MAQPNMQQLMQQAQKMQQQMQEAQQEILKSSVTGNAGGELVKITLSGDGQVQDVTIDKSVLDPEDVETVQDLVMGAFQDANSQLQQLAETKMGPLSQQLNGLGGLGF